MKFETVTEKLQNAVAIASRFVEKRANLPVLSSILIAAEEGHLLLRATNLECGVELTVQAKVVDPGMVAIPAHILAGFLSNTRGKTVSVEQKGDVVRVQTERAIASIKTLAADDFPVLPRVPASTTFTCKSADLIRAIRSVAYCASISAVKPELQSVLLYAESGKLNAVATDSFRLAEKTVTIKTPGNVPQLLIPAKNAVEFIRILEQYSGDVDVYYNENQISAHIDSIYFTSRLVDGSFPNYKQIIPTSFTTEAVVLREDLQQALKSLSIFSDKFSQVSFSIEPEKKSLFLSSQNPDVGEQLSTLRATISGEAVAMSFNGRYLADSLQAITGESVRIRSNGAGKAVVVSDAADSTFLYLAMPMNR